MGTTRTTLDPNERRRVCAFGDLDERTVRRWERGEDIRPSTEARIEQALRRARAFAADLTGERGER
jgi:NOL1/NOP2/fmu family ribosome biogenesis protein